MASIINVDKIAEATSGSGVMIPGHVIQVVEATGTAATSTNSTTAVSTGISLNVTPKYSSSKLLITFNARLYIPNATREYYLELIRGSTTAGAGYNMYSNSGAIAARQYYSFIDSPSTTSQITYTLYHKVSTNDTTVAINPNGASDGVYILQAMEIAQ
jgi:hypothetical protein